MPVEYSIVYCFLKPLIKNQFEDLYSKPVSLLGLFQVEFQDIRGKPFEDSPTQRRGCSREKTPRLLQHCTCDVNP